MTIDEPRPRVAIRREQVADAARDLFTRYGFHATGIAQIAEASGIKVQQIYRDFCNKEGIVAAIVQRDVSELFAEVSQISMRTGGGRRELVEWIRLMLVSMMSKDHPPLFLEIFAEASRNPRIAAILHEIDLQARTALTDAFGAFAARDADPARLALVTDLFLTCVGGLSQRLVAHPEIDTERLAEMLSIVIVDQIPW